MTYLNFFMVSISVFQISYEIINLGGKSRGFNSLKTQQNQIGSSIQINYSKYTIFIYFLYKHSSFLYKHALKLYFEAISQ